MDDIRETFSRLKGKLKHPLRGSKRRPDRTGTDARGERAGSSASLPQPEPHVVAGGAHDQGGDGVNTDGCQVFSTDEPLQPDEPEPAPGRDQERREGGTDGREFIQGYSHLHPDIETAVGSGRGGEVEQVHLSPPMPSIPHSGELDHNKGASTIPDNAPAVVRPDGSVERSAAVDKNEPKWISNAFATAKLLLRGVRDSADAFGPLKSVAGGLCFILENCEQTQANGRAIEPLARRVKALADSLCKLVSEGDVEERGRRERLEQNLLGVCQDLATLKEQGKIEGFVNNVRNADKLGSLVEDIRDGVMEYQTSLQQDIYDKSCRLIESTDLTILNGMQRTADASYLCGDRQGCLKGTRKEILWEIEHWLKGERDQRIFWLNGLAGTGKSTIAQTFAKASFADGKLGASFFCSRDFADRSNLQAIFPTLAFQLAYQYPPFRKELLQLLKTRPDVGRETLCSQMEKLIVGPLKATGISTLIIIDALDECKDKQPASAILSILSCYVGQIPNVKFFITGRPEPRIRSGFRLESLAPITEVLKLHEVKPEIVDSDIELFFWTQFTTLAKNRSDCNLTEDWPSSSDIKILCKKAAGFFIYASTVVKFVTSENHAPTKQLHQIISLPQSTVHEGRSGINFLYTRVLEQVVGDVDADDEELHSSFRTIVGAVSLVLNPLSVRALSDLLKVSNIPSTLRSLHSLLLVPISDAAPVHVFHKSFPDFLTDPQQCEDKRFFVEPADHHAKILLSCLRLMGERLEKNICNLDDHAVLSEVKDLSTQQKVHIGDALEYACCFWTKHLLEIPGSSSCVGEVQKAIDNFFTTHLLHWIEVLVLTRNLSVGVYAINDVEQWYNLAGVSCDWTSDSKYLLLEHFDIIHMAPFHIYHSALPFLPSSSWLCKCYNAELSHAVRVLKGLPAGWGSCSRTISLDHPPLALSYWENIIAVGLEHKDIIIIDAVTGGQTAVLSGHIDDVNTLTFSSDGKSLISGSDDKTVKLWDVQTGGVVKTFSGHTSVIWSVSISADYTKIASGSADDTIHLWDIQTGGFYCVIRQEASVPHVCFSPADPWHLLSISDSKVWQWDIGGHQIPPTYSGSHVAFSLDGTQFVLCNKRVVTVQNSDSKATVAEFHTAEKTNCCCFSPDGRLVAVAAGITAYIWDITNSDPHLVETFSGHTNSIASLVFSSPSSLVSASYDKSVRFWQIGASSTAPEAIPLNTAPIRSITLQAKDGITISSDSDGVVRTWDISTGLCKTSFQTTTKDFYQRDVRLIDGRLIFVWSANLKVYIQDVEKGKLLWEVDWLENGEDFNISGDGSRVFCLGESFIWALSIQTGEVVGKVDVKGSRFSGSLIVVGSRVWVHYPGSEYQGWDFGALGSSPVQLSDAPTFHLSDTMVWDISLSGIRDTVTGKVVFQLSGRFANPVDVQCHSCHLFAVYGSGEVLVLDINHILLQ